VTTPMFHVKRGDPTPEELAALTAVLAAKVRAATAARSARRVAGPPSWGSPAAAHRKPLPPPGPGAWRRAVVGQVDRAGGGGLWTTGDPPSAGGLWTTGDPPSAGGLPSRFGGPGSRGSGSRAPRAAGAAGAVTAGATVTAGGGDA
jgi:hypothetical protein